MKLTDLFEYDEKHGSLGNTSVWIDANLDNHGEWVITYECTELAIPNKHIHASNLNLGIKQVVEDIIEHCIWETEKNNNSLFGIDEAEI